MFDLYPRNAGKFGLYDLFCYNFTPLADFFTPPPQKITPLNYGLVHGFYFSTFSSDNFFVSK